MAVAESSRNRLAASATDIAFSSSLLEKECSSSVAPFGKSSKAEEEGKHDTLASLLVCVDWDAKQYSCPASGPTKNSSCNQVEEVLVSREIPAIDYVSRSGSSSYFAPFNDTQSESRNSLEEDDTGSSSMSLSSSATTRGPLTSRNSEDCQTEDDHSGFCNTTDGQAGSCLVDSCRRSFLDRDKLACIKDGQEGIVNEGRAPARPSSLSTYRERFEALPLAIPTYEKPSPSSADQLLSEWNDSPFVSSFPNQLNHNQRSRENSAEVWSSERFPWHIDIQNVVIGDMVATGAYGMVFKGIYKEAKVAVKVLLLPEASSKKELETLRSNFRQEIDVWYNLSHKNVVQVSIPCPPPDVEVKKKPFLCFERVPSFF
jgi:hypothetical protein